jgi:hypothetical protein
MSSSRPPPNPGRASDTDERTTSEPAPGSYAQVQHATRQAGGHSAAVDAASSRGRPRPGAPSPLATTSTPRVDQAGLLSRAQSGSTISPHATGAQSILEQPGLQPVLSSRESWRKLLPNEGGASNPGSSNKKLTTNASEASSTSKDFPEKSAMLALGFAISV